MMNLQQRLALALRDDYRIERELGVGATATVFLAYDLKHDRRVAIKVLRPELALAVGAERFLREIRTAARLTHAGLLPVYHSGEVDGMLYFAMPFVDGPSLREVLEIEGTLAIDEAIRIAGEVAAALAHAHACGVVHRDIKPENILLESRRPLVADFGIALPLQEPGDDKRLTRTGMIVGTPRYMSPEQAMGATTVDHRSDIYSLACVLYEMLCGHPPFDGETPQAILADHMFTPPARVRQHRPDVPVAVDAAIEQALAKKPSDRFESVDAFAAALVGPAPRWRRRLTARARRRMAAAAAAAFAIIAVAGAFVASRAGGVGHSPLRERDWVLVADFEGPTGDPALATTIRELVTTELNQSRYVTTLPRQQLAGTLRAAGLPETTTVNAELGRELAFRTAVRAVIGGRIVEAGDGYTLTMRAVDAANGRELASAKGDAPADSIVPTVQRVAREIRQQLGERRDDLAANQLLLDIATPSLPAYRKYVEALSRKPLGDVTGSTRLLQEAIALDSGFASAWAVMGMNYVEERNLDSARLVFQQALRRPSRLSTAQRYRLRADAAYTVDRDLPSAIRWYDEYLKEVPRSIGGRNNRGLYLSMMGRYEEALDDFERAADNSPFGPEFVQTEIMNATDMLVTLGRLDRARAKARGLTGAYAQYARLRLLTVDNRWSEADSAATQVMAMAGIPPALRIEATTTHAAALAAQESIEAADRVLADAARAAIGPQRRWYEQARSLLALANVRRLDPAPILPGDTTSGALVARAMRWAIVRDTARARQASLRIAKLSAAEQARLGYGPAVVTALLDRANERWDAVIRSLTGPARAGEHDATNVDRVPSITVRWLVADAYAHEGQRDSAAVYMQMAIAPQRVPPGHLSLRGLVYRSGVARLESWR